MQSGPRKEKLGFAHPRGQILLLLWPLISAHHTLVFTKTRKQTDLSIILLHHTEEEER